MTLSEYSQKCDSEMSHNAITRISVVFYAFSKMWKAKIYKNNQPSEIKPFSHFLLKLWFKYDTMYNLTHIYWSYLSNKQNTSELFPHCFPDMCYPGHSSRVLFTFSFSQCCYRFFHTKTQRLCHLSAYFPFLTQVSLYFCYRGFSFSPFSFYYHITFLGLFYCPSFFSCCFLHCFHHPCTRALCSLISCA